MSVSTGLKFLTLPESAYGQRLDKWLSAQLPELSRSQLQRLIADGQLQIDGETITHSSLKLTSQHQELALTIPQPKELDLTPVQMNLEVLYEDDDLIVINKPAGLTVHPAPGERNATLVHGLLAHCGESLSGIGGVQRPGIVHRLDKDTSGAILVAKHDAAHQHLAAQLKDRSLSRTYHALCYGVPKPSSGVIDAPIGRSTRDRKKMAVVEAEKGKAARTHYKLLETLADGALSLIECKLESGRTHQIRVHLTHLGHPLVGDSAYGRARKLKDEAFETLTKDFTRQALHAVELKFIHPRTHEMISCEAPYAPELANLLNQL